MTQHAFKGRGELTLAGTVLEVATEINLRLDMQRVPIAYWANLATGEAPGGIKEVAQRPRGVYLDITLHDYAPSVLAIALGSTATSVTGGQEVNLLAGDTTATYALSFSGTNKLDGKTWNFAMTKFRPDVIETVPVVGPDFGEYRLIGHSLRDTTATGREFGYLFIATG